MTRTVVIGGTPLGIEVARRLKDATLVVDDPAMAALAKRQRPAPRLVEGPETDDPTLFRAGIRDAAFVVVAVGSDERARRVIEAVRRFRAASVVVVAVEDQANVQEFQAMGVQGLVVPTLAVASAVVEMVEPSARPLHDVVLTDGAASIGTRLGALVLPGGASITAVTRANRLLPPRMDLELSNMDVVHVSSSIEDLNAVRSVLLGEAGGLFPFTKILVPVLDRSYLERELKEALTVGAICHSGVVGSFPSGSKGLIEEAAGLASSQGVPFYGLEGFDLKIGRLKEVLTAASAIDLEALGPEAERDIVRFLKKQRAGHPRHILPHGEEVMVDLLVLRAERAGRMDTLLRRPFYMKVAGETLLPMLVPRRDEPYRSILSFLEPGPRSISVTSLAMKTSVAFGADLTVLTNVTEDDVEGTRLLRHIERTGDMYGLRADIRPVHGNASLEFLALVRGGSPDLTVVDRASRAVPWDILTRIYSQAERSVLVV